MAIPRLALAVPVPGTEPSAAGLALLAGLTDLGWRVQHFRSWACPLSTRVVGQVTGSPGRHLDAWLMPPEVCRSVFAWGVEDRDLAVVEGSFDELGQAPSLGCRDYGRPGNLRPLVRALDLPTVAVVSCPRWEGLHLPNLPPGIDAVLIDGLEVAGDYDRIATAVRLVLRKPVIGAVEALPAAREALASIPRDERLPDDLVATLARSFRRFVDLDALRKLVRSRPLEAEAAPPERPGGVKFRVAYAHDEAFGGYFPDTLETLATLGAELVEFSPLRSEALPDAADLVMIGCGFPDRYADALTSNYSLMAAIRDHFYRGRRIYSEGGGTAYLGRTYRCGDREAAGVGILPIDAVLLADPPAPFPVTITLQCDTWLGPMGTEVRGYNAGRWDLRPTAELCHCAAGFGPIAAGGELVYHHHAVGSLVHLHLAALPQVVAAFAGPHWPSAAAGQADILRSAFQAAIQLQHFRNGLAQAEAAARIAVAKSVVARRLQQHAPIGARQKLRRHQPGIGRAIVEDEPARPRQQQRQIRRRSAQSELRRLLGRQRHIRRRHGVDRGKQGGDEGPPRRLGRQPALGNHFVIGLLDRLAVDVELCGEVPGAGQGASRGQTPPADCFDQGMRDLEIGRGRTVTIDDELQMPGP